MKDSVAALLFLTIGLLITNAGWILWWHYVRPHRECWHHEHYTNESWIESQLIDVGMRKRFECRKCHKVWIT